MVQWLEEVQEARRVLRLAEEAVLRAPEVEAEEVDLQISWVEGRNRARLLTTLRRPGPGQEEVEAYLAWEVAEMRVHGLALVEPRYICMDRNLRHHLAQAQGPEEEVAEEQHGACRPIFEVEQPLVEVAVQREEQSEQGACWEVVQECHLQWYSRLSSTPSCAPSERPCGRCPRQCRYHSLLRIPTRPHRPHAPPYAVVELQREAVEAEGELLV
jgi:hypothetical protein